MRGDLINPTSERIHSEQTDKIRGTSGGCASLSVQLLWGALKSIISVIMIRTVLKRPYQIHVSRASASQEK